MKSTNKSASFFLSPRRSVLTSIVLNCNAFGWYTIWNLFFFYSKNKPCNNNNKNWMQMKCRRRRKKSQRDMRQKSSTVSTQHKHSSDTILSLLIHIFNANNCGVKRKSGTNNRMQWKSACCFASCSRANRAKKITALTFIWCRIFVLVSYSFSVDHFFVFVFQPTMMMIVKWYFKPNVNETKKLTHFPPFTETERKMERQEKMMKNACFGLKFGVLDIFTLHKYTGH